ncbi:MAG TPA: hypothetical protein VM597_08990 [Gemmataceae bacterium]|nr:hypothetical protein [Gemmataceae bacterium]
MIFQFPDLETFRLAVTTSSVPAEVAAAPAAVAFDAAGRPSVQSSKAAPAAMQKALKKLGVTPAKAHYADATLAVESWPQVLPVSKLSGTPEVTSQTPVLFEMPVTEMPAVVTEMLRLGNDRQSFRTLAADGAKGERVLLKVIGPPYYTLLRAIDKTTQKGANVTAYVERAPRVWVELGHDHPLATQIRPAEGQALLLKPPRDWTAVEDGPYQDIYEVLDLKLPAAAVEWQESQLKGKLSVPLRLVAGNAADVPEMWVLTHDAVDQLDALVRDADERLMARLSFAVAEEADGTTIVLKTRPSKLSPPVLTLDKALGFKPYWKLPNLFLPVGRRLMPTLRRDAVRKLLADDPAQVVWLMPGADGKFTPELIPDTAFRPLEDWVDYIIDHQRDALRAWVQATQFDFESFVCKEDGIDKPKAPPSEGKGKKGRKIEDADGGPDIGPAPPKTAYKKAAAGDEGPDLLVAKVAPNELKVRRGEVEKEFLAHAGGLDEPERQALWPELARLNAAIGDIAEAGICWANGLWELDAVPAELSWGWLQSEDPNAKKVPTAAEWDDALKDPSPSPNDVRRFAARVVHACRLTPVPESFLARLPKVREYLEKHETVLGLRAVWLAWSHLAEAGHGQADVLALARVRDRLLNRLLTEGLNKERDLPYFLRVSGDTNSDRMRLVRDRAVKVRTLVERWHSGEDVKVNKPYVDLMFAFAFAKLGEATKARDLIAQAKAKLLEPAPGLGRPDPAHDFLFHAFAWRIDNVLQGKPHTGGLPKEMMARLDKIDEGRGTSASWRYVVDRLREQSWVLEPQEKQNPYNPWKKFGDELQNTLKDLEKIKEPARLEEAVRKLIRGAAGAEARLLVFAEAVPLVPRVGEEFAVAVVQQVPAVLDAARKQTGPQDVLVDLRDREVKLLERALFLAAHYDRRELVQALFAKFLELSKARTGKELYEAVTRIARESLRGLRKLGLKDEIDKFLKHTSDLIVKGRPLAELRAVTGRDWPDVLGALLNLAEGWLYFGGSKEAAPVLAEARETIAGMSRVEKGKPMAQVAQVAKLVQHYVTALGQGPVEDALNRIEELFTKTLGPIPNGFTTASHFSRLHLNIVEDVIRSLVSDNIALGDQARRWLDDDEYLVRRRLHADMKRRLAASGL